MTVDRKKLQADRSRAKRYRCAIAACDKSFTRLSHLQRHSLNHSETRWVCNRCNAPFKRLDLLERHKVRHTTKDGLAGGPGLGILQSRQKTISGVRMASDSGATSPSLPRKDTEKSKSFMDLAHPLSSLPLGSQQGVRGDDVSAGKMPGESGLHSTGPFLDAADMESVTSPSMHLCEMGNMYYDSAFDLVHFDVMGLTCSPPAASPTLPHIGVEHGDIRQGIQQRSPSPKKTPRINGGGAQSSHLGIASECHETQSVCGVQCTYDAMCLQSLMQDVVLQTAEKKTQEPTLNLGGKIALSLSKRDEILNLLAGIHPVTPEGTTIDGNNALLSVENLQEYINQFLRHFSSSYPMIHVATLEMTSADPIFLLSIIILGQTYKNKNTHQLSVYLYGALVPYILSGLMSIPVPDLSLLQAFLILECLGMYRAGPFQRENAMLIHTLLFSVRISPISRKE
ncbi:hypothetical protein ASPBRDRAFT_28636 [Aspergillus brasiliensis CBS 101740]|uniref:C2H2-type domain-containing protein n=1 Tax=Aspergillus brasiliensis (strain CBS 101740 / IMI 381727 / IBT 21946) TaxID=767769 RepID=A0A1L9UNT0_ASPBC|nr:hypothetical protein ASPBRDRAFT_28636 [Aspergillus brasiliensis CBS 101740]